MAQIATLLGVDIRLNEPVKQLLFDGRRVAGARTHAGAYRADATVLNADFAQAMIYLVPDHLRRRWRNHKLVHKRYSSSTLMLYLGLDGCYADIPHHTITYRKTT
jgi:phytoene desaturase